MERSTERTSEWYLLCASSISSSLHAGLSSHLIASNLPSHLIPHLISLSHLISSSLISDPNQLPHDQVSLNQLSPNSTLPRSKTHAIINVSSHNPCCLKASTKAPTWSSRKAIIAA